MYLPGEAQRPSHENFSTGKDPHPTMTPPLLIEQPVRYHEDASELFRTLGALTSTDAILLESADITTKSGLSSLGVITASLRLTCTGQDVRAEALTPSGEHAVALLRDKLADSIVRADAPAPTTAVTFRFPASNAADEHERLVATSTVAPLRILQAALPDALLAGGFAFDYLGTFEDLPPVAPGANTYPDYQFVLAEIVLDINHRTREAVLRAMALGEAEGGDVDKQVRELATRCEQPAPVDDAQPKAPAGATVTARAQVSDTDFCRHVEHLKDNIEAGDIYQVVPARAFTMDCPDAYRAYRQLRRTNPSPYMFYVRGLDSDGTPYELFGASPESNLKFAAHNRRLELYPIAGTRPRGLNPDGSVNEELDIRNELELRTDAKEIAEHTMLVDLARNDLARVAAPGTRRVAALMAVDRYSRVMHLVSRVTATLAAGLDALDAYRACMNMGTLTGAPKLRAMELLRGVEQHRRGSYGGAVGYLRGGGDMDTCIVIRSAFVTGGTAVVQAGAGVVRDSQPAAEADETLAKAYAVLHAIALAADAELEVIR